MASFSQRSEVGSLLDRMTFGVVRTLERKPGVTDVQLLDKKPAEKSAIFSWEQKNMCFLPNDLKDFYLTTDGLSMQWSIQIDGGTLPIGKMAVNSISGLTPLTQSSTMTEEKPSLFDLDDLSDDEDSQGNRKPHFDERSKCFELDSCVGFAKVCLVYKDAKPVGVTDSNPEIWLLDRALRWTYLASSFQNYFRMLIVHLGLPLWQYRFTPTGLSPETTQWFHMYAPSRLDDDYEKQTSTSDTETSTSPTNEELLINQLDVTRVFKGKQDSVKNQSKNIKKKQASNSKTNLSSRFGVLSGFKTPHRY